MCGIVGMWCHSDRDVDAARFGAVIDALAHRGPDDEGAYHDAAARLHLGHRRLAILDPTPAGAQPMTSEDGSLVIVYNGEVYNFVEVRRELSQLGHHFRTDTDTEVLLAAFRQWGEGMLPRLNGMWAFAIWDREARTLFAARDRFGVKPFLYRDDGRTFSFASELKAFAAMPRAAVRLDAATLAFSPMLMETVGPTLLEGVRSLPPGHLVRVATDGRPRERRWWVTAEHLPELPGTYAGQVEAFREQLADACRVRMRADVPLGTSLSGGLDSSSVAAMVRSVGGQEGFTADWQRIFSQGNPGTSQDESAWAAQVGDHLGATIRWTDPAVASEPSRLQASVLAFEGVHILPLGLWSHYRAMRDDGVVVSIDGHGGDELLGGYVRFTERARRRALWSARPAEWREYARVALGLRGLADTPAARRTLLAEDAGTLARPSAAVAALRTHPVVSSLRGHLSHLRAPTAPPGGIAADREALGDRAAALLARRTAVRQDAERLGPLATALYEAFHFDTLPSILRNFDRLSMASGVEIRSPLLDWRLVTFATALPDRARIGDGFTKRILRDAVQGLLPEPVRRRKDKKGFASPMIDWLAGGLGELAVDVATDASFVGRDLWDGPAIRDRIVAAHRRGDWAALKSDWWFVQSELLAQGLEDVARRAEAR